jgi:hypothetical protein
MDEHIAAGRSAAAVAGLMLSRRSPESSHWPPIQCKAASALESARADIFGCLMLAMDKHSPFPARPAQPSLGMSGLRQDCSVIGDMDGQ